MSGFFYWCVSPSLVLALTAAWTRAGNKLVTLPSLPEPVAGSQASVCSRLRAYTEHGLAMHSEGPRSVTSVRSPELKPPGLPLITGVLAPVCAEKPALRPRTDNPTPRGLEDDACVRARASLAAPSVLVPVPVLRTRWLVRPYIRCIPSLAGRRGKDQESFGPQLCGEWVEGAGRERHACIATGTPSRGPWCIVNLPTFEPWAFAGRARTYMLRLLNVKLLI